MALPAVGRGGLWGAALLAALASPGAARGYETDQLTDRGVPLPDVTGPANVEMDLLIAEAVERTNRRTKCRRDPARTKRVLARQIYRVSARNVLVWERGFFRAPGFGVYSKFMEVSLPGRHFAERGDIYGDMTFWDAVILHLAGPCSTYFVAGVLLGSDKLDHFLDEGFAYWRRSRFGERPERAVAYGTGRENSLYGLLTSRTFSFGDLKANHDGMRFYDGLLEEGSVVRLDEQGCVEQARPWRWGEWVDWHYDEVLEPSVYVPRVQRRLDETLAARSEALCEDLPRWAPEGFDAVRAAHPLTTEHSWIGERAPERVDPFGLAALCSPHQPLAPASGD